MRAAMQLFAERGFQETSVARVAQAAGVSKALVFWHFRNKEELFAAVIDRLLEPYILDVSGQDEALDERAQLNHLVVSYLKFVQENAASVRFFLQQLLRGQRTPASLSAQIMKLYAGYRDLLVDLIARAQQKRRDMRAIAPETAATFLMWALNGILVGLLFTGNGIAEPQSAVSVLDKWLFDAGLEDDSLSPSAD
ncbi:MAG: TetR/AcrR family transcriptional regulator [Deltaproteobacteria bacterium]|nr:TetR/AcrR family transcriptional regulator [Deltaproteobacteria bacterium]